MVTPLCKHIFHTKSQSTAMIGLPRDYLPLPVIHQQWALMNSVFASNISAK